MSKEEIKMEIVKYLELKKKQMKFLISMEWSQNNSEGKFYTLKCIYKRKNSKWTGLLVYKVRKNKPMTK